MRLLISGVRGSIPRLVRFGDPDAIAVLADALARLNPSFVRTETALRVDLATAFAASGDRDEARTYVDHASLARGVGWLSILRRRITT